MMKNNGLKQALLVSVLGVVALSGCATSYDARQAGLDAEAGDYVADDPRYGPGDRVFKGGNVDTVFHHDRSLAEARAIEKASYQGIEGARLAHELYRGPRAEELDGSCETRVVVNSGETLWDIADFCDVSVFDLGDFNPALGPKRLVRAGDVLSIPHAAPFNLEDLRGSGVDSLPLNPLTNKVSAYRIRPGDTLSEIAQRHSVSAASIANLNPATDWRTLQIGAVVNLPAAPQLAATAPKRKASGVHASPASTPILAVNKRAARVGERIKLAAAGLPPSTQVRLYRGLNRRDMELVGAFVTNAAGELYADATIVKTPNRGGLIFAAAVDDGDYLFSRRINVVGK